MSTPPSASEALVLSYLLLERTNLARSVPRLLEPTNHALLGSALRLQHSELSQRIDGFHSSAVSAFS